MLGKTNVTAIEGDTNITEIENYRWNHIKINGINSDFVRAVYGNDILVAITKDGTVTYTKDGENWDKVRLGLEGEYELTDIIWNGSNYVMVGNQIEIVQEPDGSEYKYHGIVVTTENLVDFIIEQDEDNIYSRYYSIIEENGKRIIISKEFGETNKAGIYAVIKNSSGTLKITIIECKYITSTGKNNCCYLNKYEVVVAKKASGGAVYVREIDSSSSNQTGIYTTANWTGYQWNRVGGENQRTLSSIFECKDNLFVYSEELGHLFYKLMSDNRNTQICKGTPFFFIDAIYFNKCEIFLNRHSMIVVRQGEKIEDKTLDDLLDITYEFNINFIEKAFDGLYIFGTDGHILISSDEVKNEETTAVKSMSAVRALYDAKVYTDEKYAALEARIMELEKRS